MADVVIAGRVIVANQKVWPINRIGFKWRPPFIYLTEDFDLHYTTFLMLLSLLGWAAWQARRKYGVQKS